MSKLKLQIVTAGIGIGLTIALSFFLPDRVATHFSFSGEPNDWSSNSTNTIFFCAAYLILNLIFIGVTALIRKLPPSMINMPNRDYWLSAERREESSVAMSGFMAEFGIFINFFLIAVQIVTFFANRSATSISPTPLVGLSIAFVLFMISWLVRFLRRFKKPQNA